MSQKLAKDFFTEQKFSMNKFTIKISIRKQGAVCNIARNERPKTSTPENIERFIAVSKRIYYKLNLNMQGGPITIKRLFTDKNSVRINLPGNRIWNLIIPLQLHGPFHGIASNRSPRTGTP